MIKWLRRLILYPILLIAIMLTIFFIVKPRVFYMGKAAWGTVILQFGYETRGVQLIEKSIEQREGKVSSSIYHGYSVQNTKNGNYDEAIKYLERAINLSPEDGDGYYGWVLLYYYRDYPKALFHLERLDATTPNVTDYVGDDNIIYAKALCYKQLKKYDKALELFSLAIEDELEKHNEEWITHHMYFQKGRTLDLLGRTEEAIKFYDKAIENWEDSSESIYYKGLAEIKINNMESGCSNLKIAYEKVKRGIKSADSYVKLFDEVYELQIEESIKEYCD